MTQRAVVQNTRSRGGNDRRILSLPVLEGRDVVTARLAGSSVSLASSPNCLVTLQLTKGVV